MSMGRYVGYAISQCENCTHATKWGDGAGRGWQCKAFVDEIPPEIVKGKIAHDRPIAGDGGYYYTPRVYEDTLGTYHYTFFNRLVVDTMKVGPWIEELKKQISSYNLKENRYCSSGAELKKHLPSLESEEAKELLARCIVITERVADTPVKRVVITGFVDSFHPSDAQALTLLQLAIKRHYPHIRCVALLANMRDRQLLPALLFSECPALDAAMGQHSYSPNTREVRRLLALLTDEIAASVDQEQQISLSKQAPTRAQPSILQRALTLS